MSEISRSASIQESAARPSVVAPLLATTKQGISKLVTVTATVGFIVSATRFPDRPIPWLAAVGAIVGTWLAASGANSLNQWLEASRDLKMPRTTGRPIPSGQVSGTKVAAFGTLISTLGVLLTLLLAGAAPALLSLVCVVSYLFAYTPLKVRTVHNTLIGSIPGALPAMIGTAAAMPVGFGARLTDPLGWTLVAVLAIWQIPHFLAIAWMYRDDYQLGGFRMLPQADPAGRLTASVMLVTALAFGLAAGLLPMTTDVLGIETLIAGLLVGAVFVAYAARFTSNRTQANARSAFFVSIIVLPVYLIFISGAAIFRGFF